MWVEILQNRWSFPGLAEGKSGENRTLRWANICLNTPRNQAFSVRRWYFSSYCSEEDCGFKVCIYSGRELLKYCVLCGETWRISLLPKSWVQWHESNYKNGTFNEKSILGVFWVVPVSRVKRDTTGGTDIKFRQCQTCLAWSFNYSTLMLVTLYFVLVQYLVTFQDQTLLKTAVQKEKKKKTPQSLVC